jgi:hypothetical protein
VKVDQASPDLGGIVNTIVIVVVVLVAGWLLLAWVIVKRPVLALPVAAFTGLVLLVGMHDAQALAIYAWSACGSGGARTATRSIVWWVGGFGVGGGVGGCMSVAGAERCCCRGWASAAVCVMRSRGSRGSRARGGVIGCWCGCCWGSARRTSSAPPRSWRTASAPARAVFGRSARSSRARDRRRRGPRLPASGRSSATGSTARR